MLIVRNPAQAEEVSQESSVKIWRTSNRFDPRRGSAISWILMVTHAAAVDRVRSAQALTRREDSYAQQVQAHVWARPNPTHDRACAVLEASRVHDALAELSAVQREARPRLGSGTDSFVCELPWKNRERAQQVRTALRRRAA